MDNATDMIGLVLVTCAKVCCIGCTPFLAVLFVRIRNPEKPRDYVATVIRRLWTFFLLDGVFWSCVGALTFGIGHVFGADLQAQERHDLVKWGLSFCLHGLVCAIVTAVRIRSVPQACRARKEEPDEVHG